MHRRSVLSLLGTSAAAWPLAARAQQPAMPMVGYLNPGIPDSNVEAAFRKGLGEQGLIEGRNVAIEYRFARNDYDRLPELAADLVGRRVAIIATVGGNTAALAAQAATRTIPIVFQTAAADPVEAGLVASFNRPGGNITGITSMNTEIDGKRLGLLCDLVPKAVRIGFLGVRPDNHARISGVHTAAAALGRQIEVLVALTSREIDDAFANLSQKRIDAVLAVNNPILYGLRVHLATAAARAGVPIMYMERAYAEAGGLMSYGPNILDTLRLVGIYVGRILKREKPADLPVIRPTKFEFVINLQTARLLRIDIPDKLLALADEVIE